MRSSESEVPRVTRRSFLRQSAGATTGVAAGMTFGSTAALAESSDRRGRRNPLLTARPGPFASRQKLKRWNEYLAGLGPRHTGSPAETRFRRNLQEAMDRLGWDTSTRTQGFTSWEAQDFSLEVAAATSRVEKVRVAYYYPYSGRTPRVGIEGELAYAGKGGEADFAQGDFAGKIAVIDVPPFSIPIGIAFNTWDETPPGVDPTLPYDRAWIAAGPGLEAATAAGAVGAIIILSQSPECAKGQYAPFGRALQGIPALNVDAQAGKRVRALAQGGGTMARLTLTAKSAPGKVKPLLATLPGASDEVIVVNTHTDGTNLIEENGPLAMLSIAQRLSARKRSERPATVAFYFASGHFQDEVISSGAYVTDYPELYERTKAGLTIEHLGCREYLDDHEREYVRTGRPEISGLFASNRTLADLARPALDKHGVTRCSVIQPVPRFFGEGRYLHEAGIPMLSYISGPNYLLAESSRKAQLKRFSLNRMQAEIKAMGTLLDQLAAIPRSGAPT
ncbi:MAG: hypothetical protein EDQ89_04600 [Acidobacteria bacterium]|nr:MAG: hypothetical protein EDQ89_04600 [Acidobacteriota bacterium]